MNSEQSKEKHWEKNIQLNRTFYKRKMINFDHTARFKQRERFHAYVNN